MNKITVFLAILLLTLFVTACADVDAPAVRQNALPAGVQATCNASLQWRRPGTWKR